MPNFDGGHYFLTCLSPIKVQERPDDLPEGVAYISAGAPRESFTSQVQRALRELPTAEQSPATIAIAEGEPDVISPFAKTPRTHLARFVVLEELPYNGRVPTNTLLVSLGIKPGPTVTQPVDCLPCPYLMFAADIDATTRAGDPLPSTLTEEEQDSLRDDYLIELWEHSEPQLRRIYENCQGFDGVASGREFAAYMKKCQIETWMPFNDYYTEPPQLGEAVKDLPWKLLFGIMGVPVVATLFFLLAWILGVESCLGMPAWLCTLLAGAVNAAAIYGVVQWIVYKGKQPWPPSNFGSLPAVLKGLYIQQRFADFAFTGGAMKPEELHAAFGKFLDDHKPDDVNGPTQRPGVIASRPPEIKSLEKMLDTTNA